MNPEKLVLGTVQFGCQYGINSAGRPSADSVSLILETAAENGIMALDTSSAYGNSEEVLGECNATERGFRIVSKYPRGFGDVGDACRASIGRLGTDSLYAYLLHHFDVYREDHSIWDGFRKLREDGMVRKVGFSLYSPRELEVLLDNEVDFDILQFPRNIFDRQFDPYLPELKERGVEIHVRSTFLQGLFFKDRSALPQKLLPMRRYLLELDEISSASGMDIASLALGFNCSCEHVDGVLIGVDNREQLLANITAAASAGSSSSSGSAEGAASAALDIEIDVVEKELLNPVNWN